MEAALYRAAREVFLVVFPSIFSAILHGGSRVEFLDRYKLDAFVNEPRPSGVPLITVANHASTMDDPLLMSAIMPSTVLGRAERMRWGVCTEDICFASAPTAAFMGLGKALPVKRGGSIYQKGLATLQDKVNMGEWVHVFPEGRCWQEGGTPLRDGEGRWCSASGRCGPSWQKVGPFKWGVGKIIANSSVIPTVVPLFHSGMPDIMTQDRDNQICSGPNIVSGIKLTVLAGDPVPVAPLIEAYHEAARGRAQKRNEARQARLSSARGRMVDSPAAASWWWPFPVPAAAAALSVDTLPIPALRPVNTVEDFADHSGESAHVAGIRRKVTEAEAESVLALEAAVHATGGGMLHEVVVEAAAATARVQAAARSKGEELRRQAADAVSALAAEAEEVKAKVSERLSDSMSELGETVDSLAGPVSASLRDMKHRAQEEGEETARRLRAKLESGTAKVRAGLESFAGGRGWSGGQPAGQGPFAASISVPQPPVISVQKEHKLTVPLPRLGSCSAGPSEKSGAAGRRVMAADPVLAMTPSHSAGGGAMVDLIPTRVLRTGIVIPAYVEPTTLIVPPDHEYLTPSEAEEEEDHRLRLYSDLANKLADAVAVLERRVMAHRAAQGIVESRPMG